MKKYIRNFAEVNLEEGLVLGVQNSYLGELFQKIPQEDLRVPDGFFILANAYSDLLAMNHVQGKLEKILSSLDTSNFSNLRAIGRKARQLILDCTLPYHLQVAILAAYEQLKEREGDDIRVVVRPSFTIPTWPSTEMLKQAESYLNITDGNHLLEACLYNYTALFSDAAIRYRAFYGYDHLAANLSIAVQKMIRSDLSCSGIGFSFYSEKEKQELIKVKSSWGLGTEVLSGVVSADEFVLRKTLRKPEQQKILSRSLGSKQFYLRCHQKPSYFSATTEYHRTPEDLQAQFSLQDREVKKLARWAQMLEAYFEGPIKFAWAKDGLSKQLFLIQVNPLSKDFLQRPEPHLAPAYRAGNFRGSK